MSKKINNYILLIFCLALGLRLVGITHAFPFIFHPDEATIVRSALEVRFFKNPGHFDWPHLYIYLNYFVYMIFAKIRTFVESNGLKETVYFWAPIIWDDGLIFYLLTRIVSAFFGAFTIFPIYLAAKNLFGEKVGLYAALALAITPFHVWHSHYTLPDIPMLFFLSWALYYSSFILFRRDMKNYLLAGLFVGLAASTKYNGALGALFVVLAHLFRVATEKDELLITIEGIKSLVYSGLASIFGFVLGTPYSVLDYETFLRTDGPKGALWQFTNVGDVSLGAQMRTFFEVLVGKLQDDFGYTFLILFLLAALYFVFTLYKDKKLFSIKDIGFLVVSGVLLIFYVSGLEKTRSHYFFIVYPAVLIAGIGFFHKIVSGAKYKMLKHLWLVVFLVPLVFSTIRAYTFYQKDTRVQMYYWLQKNIGEHSMIYYNTDDITPVMKALAHSTSMVQSARCCFEPGSLIVMGDYERSDLKLVHFFDNVYRKGPYIRIYER